jgi:hypothetical protein
MNFKLHQAMISAHRAAEQILNTDFNAQHGMDQLIPLKDARDKLMDALDALSAYQATLKSKQVAA